jgi:hypothetical protein
MPQPEPTRLALRDAPLAEVAAAVLASRWPQLGLWCADDHGVPLLVALLAEAERAMQADKQYRPGVLGVLLVISRFCAVPRRYHPLLKAHLEHRWAQEIHDATGAVLARLPVAQAEAVLLPEAGRPRWHLLSARPIDRAVGAAGAARSGSSRASTTTAWCGWRRAARSGWSGT